MRRSGRIIGIALASAVLGWFVASLLLFGLFAIMGSRDYNGTGVALGLSAVIIAWSLPTALISTSTLGMLWHAHALKRRLTKKADYWLPGMMIGGLVAAVVPFITLPGIGLSWMPLIALGTLYGAACGGLTGLYAWLMRRPDRDVLNTNTANEQAVTVGSAAFDDAPPSERAESKRRPDLLRPWTQAIAIGFAIVTVVLVLWAALMSPR